METMRCEQNVETMQTKTGKNLKDETAYVRKGDLRLLWML